MDPELLGALIDRWAAPLVLFARQWCDEPDDVVQEAFARLAEEHAQVENPQGWLYRVVRNRAINAGKAGRRRRHHESRAALRSDAWFDDAELEGLALPLDQVQAALESLPIEQREVIVARLWGSLSFEQIAELAAMSASAAHRHYHAGLKALRERLGVSWQAHSSRSMQS